MYVCMDILKQLPPELKNNVFLHTQHPVAKLLRKEQEILLVSTHIYHDFVEDLFVTVGDYVVEASFFQFLEE